MLKFIMLKINCTLIKCVMMFMYAMNSFYYYVCMHACSYHCNECIYNTFIAHMHTHRYAVAINFQHDNLRISGERVVRKST